jgi:hypothetical protein
MGYAMSWEQNLNKFHIKDFKGEIHENKNFVYDINDKRRHLLNTFLSKIEAVYITIILL